MKNARKVTSLSLAAFGLFFSAAAPAEMTGMTTAPTMSIESCVAEIRGHADYSGSKHVRHVVETTGRRSLAYRISLNTKVFGDNETTLIREYTTKCVVYGGQKPVSFKIEESGSGA